MKSLLEPEPRVDLELDEGEVIRYVGRRHWIEVVQNGGIFLLIALFAGALAIYRAVGGTFFIIRPGEIRPLTDPVNLILIVLLLALLFLWARGTQRKPQNKPNWYTDVNFLYIGAAAVTALAIWFRSQGGEILHFDPNAARPTDLLNIILMTTALVAFGLFVYLYIDWKDDFFLVTNVRVVYDDQQLFVRHIQQQVLISDIQQVNTAVDSYPAVWFGFGRLVIRSFSTRTLRFDYANRPKEIEAAIQAEVSKLRRAAEPELLRRMIEDQVYGNKPPPKPAPAIQVHTQESPIAWLFPPNPEIRGDTITWRPAWIFMALALSRPVGGFLLVLAAVTMLGLLGALPLEFGTPIIILALLIFGGWFYWIREELINDVYILNRSTIIDVDRKPFGPESVRRAQLGAIQDISFDVSFIESLLGYGTVVVTTGGAGGGKFTFNHVPDPRGVQATINDYLTDFRQNERERQLQDSLTLIKQYHAVQRDKGEKISRDDLNRLIAAQAEAAVASRAQALTPPPAPEGAETTRLRRRRPPWIRRES